MRETLAYTKDFITGQTVFEKKQKQDTGIKGKVTLSLYDAKTQEKIKEAYTENLIPDLFFKDTFYSTFLNGVMGCGDKRSTENFNWFNYIYLTDCDKPESPKEQRVMGNVIGYAHRNDTYSGTSTLRGTINKAETKFEIIDSKARLNFVFDFPSHTANGTTESIYFCTKDMEHKDYFYVGAPIYAREGEDNGLYILDDDNPKRYYALYNGFNYSIMQSFISTTKGYFLLDCKNTNITQTSLLKFPENLKGHMVLMPFDVNINDAMLWESAVKLLDQDGNPLEVISSDSVKKYNGLSYAMPYNDNIIGYYLFDKNVNSRTCKHIRIYTWNKVGVLENYVDVNLEADLKDEYDSYFEVDEARGNRIFSQGKIAIVGTNTRYDEDFNEYVYTNRFIELDALGNIVTDMNIKPKIGNSTWFGEKSMNSENIERRCYIYDFHITENKIYLKYLEKQGGSRFWQCISNQGNLIDAHREHFSFESYNLYDSFVVCGTDIFVAVYTSSSFYFGIYYLLTSAPIGTHTRLAQPIEKTEANTMKVQYLFEIDLPIYGEDFY